MLDIRYRSHLEVQMKLKMISILFCMVFLAACTAKTTETAAIDSTHLPGYPADGETVENGYPAPYEIVNTPDLRGFITDTPDPVKIPIIISEVRKFEGYETVVIKNISDHQIDIGGWMLYTPELSEKFTVPSPTLLEPGGEFTVNNGNSKKAPGETFWLATTIINKLEDEVWLLNAGGAISFYFVYYPSEK